MEAWKTVCKFTEQVEETREEFIFTTLCNWLSETTQLVVSKQLLLEALVEYRERHPLKFVVVAKTTLDTKIEENDDEEV